jgi:hypothetical protein
LHWLGFVSIALGWLAVLLALASALAPFLPLGESEIDNDARKLVVGVVFASSSLALAVDRMPGLGINRAGITLVEAYLMMIESGPLSPE